LGAPDRGVHSVQIEINRALYLDEEAVEKREGFDALARCLEQLSKDLTAL
jgi:N-formylglutamate amidohydrolase